MIDEKGVFESVAYRDVLLDPVPDEPRERLARHLEETHPELAAFIRAQVALNRNRRRSMWRLVRVDPLEPYVEMLRLWTLYGRQWRMPRPHELGWLKRGDFVRGCIESVTVDAAEFLCHGEQLYDLLPVLHVTFENAAPVMRDLAASRLLARLRTMTFWRNGLGDCDVFELVSSPFLQNLRALYLNGNRIGMSGVEAICRSRYAGTLQYVNLGENLVEDPGESACRDGMNGEHVDMSDTGRLLEQRYGYLRWLHDETRTHGEGFWREDFDVEEDVVPVAVATA